MRIKAADKVKRVLRATSRTALWRRRLSKFHYIGEDLRETSFRPIGGHSLTGQSIDNNMHVLYEMLTVKSTKYF